MTRKQAKARLLFWSLLLLAAIGLLVYLAISGVGFGDTPLSGDGVGGLPRPPEAPHGAAPASPAGTPLPATLPEVKDVPKDAPVLPEAKDAPGPLGAEDSPPLPEHAYGSAPKPEPKDKNPASLAGPGGI